MDAAATEETTSSTANDGEATQSAAEAKSLVLPSLEIKNFRAFRHLTIEKLGRVNLITGKNNVGKTSLLEALWLYAEGGSPDIIRRLLEERDELGEPLQFVPIVGFVSPKHTTGFSVNDVWLPYIASLFHNRQNLFRYSPPITIGELSKPDQWFVLNLGWGHSVLGEQGSSQFVPLSEKDLGGNVVNAKPFLSMEKGGINIRRFTFDKSGMDTIHWQKVVGITSVFVPSTGLGDEERSRFWSMIELADEKQELIMALRILAPQVNNLAFRDNEYKNKDRVPFARQNSSRDVAPLKSLGQGMIKVLDIALGLTNQSNGILLIDEIENGLHYSVLPDVWRLIFQTARRLNVQVFATTHSWDCIEAFQEVASEDDDPTSGVLVRLQNENGEITSTIFDERRLAIVTRDGIEVR